MSDRNMLITCLKHYCDMIWEYDRESEKIIIHYDVTAQKYVGRSYTAPEIIGIFGDEFDICVNGRICKSFDNIISISLETEICVIIHARNMASGPKNDSDYNALIYRKVRSRRG